MFSLISKRLNVVFTVMFILFVYSDWLTLTLDYVLFPAVQDGTDHNNLPSNIKRSKNDNSGATTTTPTTTHGNLNIVTTLI